MKKHWYKDMHYAEFAEDEVRVSPPVRAILTLDTMFTNISTEPSPHVGDQGVREQQVEGDWPEGWQASKGLFLGNCPNRSILEG